MRWNSGSRFYGFQWSHCTPRKTASPSSYVLLESRCQANGIVFHTAGWSNHSQPKAPRSLRRIAAKTSTISRGPGEKDYEYPGIEKGGSTTNFEGADTWQFFGETFHGLLRDETVHFRVSLHPFRRKGKWNTPKALFSNYFSASDPFPWLTIL